MRFAYPWLLWCMPAVLAGLWLAQRHGAKRRRRLLEVFTGDPRLRWSEPGYSQTRQKLGTLFLLASVAFMITTLARPLVLSRAPESELQGVPYLFALDVSRSMLATDAQPSRYAAASNALDQWLADDRADRVGLVTFAGDAYLNAPLTFDTAALRTVLRFIEPEDVYEGGTALAKSIERSASYFVSNNVPHRLLVIVSDGEELEGSAMEAARACRRQHDMTTCTIGVGTSKGTRVPANRRAGAWGNAKNSFGQEVTTRLDEANLKRIANAGGGKYYPLGANGEGLRQLKEEVIRPLAEAAAKDNLQNYTEIYQIPLALGLFGLLARLFVQPEGRQRAPEKDGRTIMNR